MALCGITQHCTSLLRCADGDETMEAISVTYAFVDGAHFFTSEDPKWSGLCAASVELETAWDDVSFQLNELAKLNHGIKDPGIKPAMSLDDFVAGLKEAIDSEFSKIVDQALEADEKPSMMVPPSIAAWKMEQMDA